MPAIEAGKKLSQFDYAANPSGADTYAEQGGESVRIRTGEPNGLAVLGSDGKIPAGHVPDDLPGDAGTLRADLADEDTGGDAVGYTPPSTGVASTIRGFLDALWSNTGAALIQFLPSGTGSVIRTIRDWIDDRVHVTSFMTAAQKSDVRAGAGSLDVSAAVQAAIDYAHSLGGREVYAPAGVYRLGAAINVRDGVSLVGEGCSPYTNSTPDNPKPRGGGTWFHADHAGVAFQCNANVGSPVGSGAVICKLGVFRTHATPAPGWTPTVYDFDIVTLGVDLTVEDVCLLNPYKGIKITSAGFGRLHVNRLKMQAFHTGIHLEQSFDTCRIENVHQWPFWSDHADVRGNTLANLATYRVDRSDNAMISHCFSIYHNKALSVNGDGIGNTAYRLDVSNCNFDPGTYAVVYEPGADMSTGRFSGCTIVSNGVLPTAAILMDCDNARVSFSNCEFAECGANGIRINGTGNKVTLNLAQVRNWNLSGGGFSGIEVAAGNSLISGDRIYFEGGAGGAPFGGAGTISAPLGYAEFSGNTDASGDVTITHGLGIAPRNIMLTFRAPDGAWILRVEAITSTQFKVSVRLDTGAIPGAGTGVNFYWRADY